MNKTPTETAAQAELIGKLDQRIRALEQLCSLAPGQVNLVDAYQLIVNDLAGIKRAVIALQEGRRATSGDEPATDISTPRAH